MNHKNQFWRSAVEIALIAVLLLYGCVQQPSDPVNDVEFVINSTVRMKIPAEIASSESIHCVFAHHAYQNGGDLYQATGSKASISQAWDRLAGDLKCAEMLYGSQDRPGPTGSSGGQQLANDINQHLSQFARMANRPELVTAPLVLTGLSAAGSRVFWTAYTIPDRIIAVVPYHGYSPDSGAPSQIQGFIDEVMSHRSRIHEIPVLYVMAANDPTRVPGIQGINETVRNNGGLWTSVIQPDTGHANMGDQSFITTWLREVIEQRTGQGQPLSTLSEQTFVGTYTLAALPNGNYYFKDPQIFSANEYSGALSNSIWLPSRMVANEWLSYSLSGQN